MSLLNDKILLLYKVIVPFESNNDLLSKFVLALIDNTGIVFEPTGQ